MFLDDIYGEQEILRDGVHAAPAGHVAASTSTARPPGIVPPNGVRIHVAGIDLVRDEQGTFRVLEDNLRIAVGGVYVMENRRTMARVFPNLFATPPGARGRRLRVAPAAGAAQRRRLRTRPTRPSSCSPPASTTRRTSSTRCWPGRWASSWSRAATCSAATTPSTCAPPRASGRSTSSTGASTTSSSTRMQFKPDSVLGVAGRAQRRPRGQRGDLQRGRQRRRRRQARLHLRARRSSSTTSARSRCWPTSTRSGAGSTTSARRCSTASTSW